MLKRNSSFLQHHLVKMQVETNPLKVGITGGIGSGKTTVCNIFQVLGIPVYFADTRAKELMIKNELVKSKVIALFGNQTYLPDGTLNRSLIASQVFDDKAKLEFLNSIVHPAVAEDYEQWHAHQLQVPYTLKEAALLFESGSYKALDFIILVTAPKALRIKRVTNRDNSTQAAVEARMQHQYDEKVTIPLSDFVIVNDEKLSLVRQVWAIHRTLMQHFDEL
jgi:dephospho-CoA kinase